MNRRDFISWVGVGALANFLPVTIAACSSRRTIKDWHKVASKADLDASKQILQEGAAFGKVLLVQTSNTDKPIAVDPTCTHAGCAVDWNSDRQKFVCPCHQSEFTADGQVTKAPARAPLTIYAIKIEGDDIFVKSV